MRPVLRPGLQLLRRDATTLQIGVDPSRAVVLNDCPQAHAVLDALDGVRRTDEVVNAAERAGIDSDSAISTLRALWDYGVLEDADELASRGELGGCGPGVSEPDLANLSLLAPFVGSSGPSSLRALRGRRRCASVAVYGLAGVGAVAARLLAAAGVGALMLPDEADTEALRTELRARAPWTMTLPPRSNVDVVLLAPDAGCTACEPDRDQASALMRAGIAHCVATVRETTGVLGPFVVPGDTSCLRCLDLARAEADPAWPALLAQLVSAGRSGPTRAAADATLTTLIGAWAAAELLAYVCDLPTCTAGATLEIALANPIPSRREWAVHPVCGCGWQRAATMGE